MVSLCVGSYGVFFFYLLNQLIDVLKWKIIYFGFCLGVLYDCPFIGSCWLFLLYCWYLLGSRLINCALLWLVLLLAFSSTLLFVHLALLSYCLGRFFKLVSLLWLVTLSCSFVSLINWWPFLSDPIDYGVGLRISYGCLSVNWTLLDLPLVLLFVGLRSFYFCFSIVGSLIKSSNFCAALLFC